MNVWTPKAAARIYHHKEEIKSQKVENVCSYDSCVFSVDASWNASHLSNSDCTCAALWSPNYGKVSHSCKPCRHKYLKLLGFRMFVHHSINIWKGRYIYIYILRNINLIVRRWKRKTKETVRCVCVDAWTTLHVFVSKSAPSSVGSVGSPLPLSLPL